MRVIFRENYVVVNLVDNIINEDIIVKLITGILFQLQCSETLLVVCVHSHVII